MATTTNYGWTTPDDTALVKDGAAAIRSLGTSIDTTTKNLNPSTTLGDLEYRSSTSNTNTRIPIGTSGQGLQVVGGVPAWAASSTSTLTTTGDLLYASAANTLARRAIGSTGDVLTVSGGLPTWSAPVTGSMTLISTTSLSGASTTISSIPSTYNHLFLMFTNFRPATDGSILRVAMNGASQGENGVNMISSSSSTTSQAGADIIRLTEGVGSGTQQKTAWLYILDYSATTDKGYFGGSAYLNTGNTSNTGFFVGGATRASTSAISSLVISFSAGNITSGSVKLYGVK